PCGERSTDSNWCSQVGEPAVRLGPPAPGHRTRVHRRAVVCDAAFGLMPLFSWLARSMYRSTGNFTSLIPRREPCRLHTRARYPQDVNILRTHPPGPVARHSRRPRTQEDPQDNKVFRGSGAALTPDPSSIHAAVRPCTESTTCG